MKSLIRIAFGTFGATANEMVIYVLVLLAKDRPILSHQAFRRRTALHHIRRSLTTAAVSDINALFVCLNQTIKPGMD